MSTRLSTATTCAVVDDLLATGGTIEATVKLIRRLGGKVTDAAFIINCSIWAASSVWKNEGLPVIARCRFRGVIQAIRTAILARQPRCIGEVVLAYTLL